ncbi:hypothetical protein L6654_25420 [Bradyrhizobium sp. WYCCWR 13023]|uniref:Uncharacterized protein n=1 Tax=Bradyrhizobium zhengyangense TaxID=2911009 RepID=A0A9X1U9A0_9BRAD|nr:hypothetical protein [Bradyrhizobium zhengyangense]MCG2629970.1 hypothetical protein [Bradyrhizobium zhengyangense]MCG2639513.1 hypothetical protein [Bradyrhizobium zhengyangense]MCG2672449.1 hypothetical protein [Bradyrhizobium zhengyangense]
MSAKQDHTAEHLIQYLRQLAPQVRRRLLAELERLHLLGEDIPHSEPLIAALRAEFRNTGQNHYRVGNPSRYFFEPLEPVLVDRAPERANSGQIARGSLAPIWSLVTEQLLRSMAADYIANATDVISADRQHEARQLAQAFQKKVLISLNGLLGSAEGAAGIRDGLMAYTSSHATFDDLKKMLRYLDMQRELEDFGRALPPKIARLEGASLDKVLGLLTALKARHADAVPFALTIVAKRLETPWELLSIATVPADDRAAARIAASPFAIAVSMVIDQIEEKHLLLLFALRNSRPTRAKEIVSEIYRIEEALRTEIELRGSEWAQHLDELMTAVQAAVDAEISTIPGDHRHLTHILESPRLRPDHSFGHKVGHMFEKGWDVVAGLLAGDTDQSSR